MMRISSLSSYCWLLAIMAAAQCAPAQTPAPSRETQLLTALVHDVLHNGRLERSRKFYGTPGDTVVVLMDGSAKWPSGFIPEVKGFSFVRNQRFDEHTHKETNRRLAIRLDRFSLDETEAKRQADEYLKRTPIRISVQNGGGFKNGAVMGGITVWYDVAFEQGRWTVVYSGAVD